ncbi:hypothetical protein ABH930_006488 [Kitasatospora sp. GAS204A]|nr:hypothetical protein [Kitasatospora sp. GAS204B]
MTTATATTAAVTTATGTVTAVTTEAVTQPVTTPVTQPVTTPVATTAAAPGTTGRIEAAVERVAAALTEEPRQHGPGRPAAPAAALGGAAGVALLLTELARRDSGRLPAAHGRLTVAAKALTNTASVGLHHGPAAVLVAVQAAARLGGHYPRLRHTLTAHVATEQLARLAAQPAGPGVDWSSYDAIAGASGTGRVLLTAVTDGDAEERAAAEPALRATLAHLVALSRPVRVGGRQVPGWWVPGHRQLTAADRARFPRGDINLGTAHGIAGPLALLARSAELEVTVDGQLAAVRRIGGWLAARADHDASGPYWQPRLPLDEEIARACGGPTSSAAPVATAAAAWCYGSVSIAGALLRAARVTGEEAWYRLALDSAHAVLARPGTLDHLKGPTVCHGEAGFLQSLWRLGRQAEDPVLLDHCARLADRLAAAFDQEAVYGYRHLAPAHRDRGWQPGRPPSAEDNPGILEGAAGVAAALLSVLPGPGSSDHEQDEPVWDRVLLLS